MFEHLHATALQQHERRIFPYLLMGGKAHIASASYPRRTESENIGQSGVDKRQLGSWML